MSDAALRDTFVDPDDVDRYGEGAWATSFGGERAGWYRKAAVGVIGLLSVAGLGFLVTSGGEAPESDEVVEPVGEEASEPPVAEEPDPSDDAVDSPPPGSEDDETANGAAEEAPATEPTGTSGDPLLDAILIAAGVDPGDPRLVVVIDALRDHLDSIRAVQPAYIAADVDMVSVVEALLSMSESEVDRVFNNSTIECGETMPFVVVCPPGVDPMPPGDVVTLALQLDAPAASEGADRSYIYSAVFDSDGEPGNDWRFNPPFDFDLFQGTDRWYEVAWSHVAQRWTLSVSQVAADQTVTMVPSSARVAISGSNVVFFVPTSEVGAGAYRLTAFAHDGAFSEATRGADVSGADPTVSPTLVSAEPIETTPR